MRSSPNASRSTLHSRYARARDLAEDLHRFLEHLPMKHGAGAELSRTHGQVRQTASRLVRNDVDRTRYLVRLDRSSRGGSRPALTACFRDVHARLKIRQFDRNFTEIQFLLNTAAGSDEHLKRGLTNGDERARQLEAADGIIPLERGLADAPDARASGGGWASNWSS